MMRRQEPFHVHGRRGLTLIELLLAATITVMVGAAIMAMLGAVSAGVGSRRDSRQTMIRAAAARSRIDAYSSPARCILACTGPNLTLWFEDSRESETVHASEIRWLRFNAASGEVNMYFVHFPESWSKTAKDLEDREYASNTDWDTVLAYYQNRGYLARLPLIDHIASLSFKTDSASATSITHLTLAITFEAEDQDVPMLIPATITTRQPPKS